MKPITLLLILLAFSVVTTFAQPKAAATDVTKSPEVKPEPAAKAPKTLSPEQITRLRQAQDVREKAQLRLAVVRSELGQIEAEIAALVRLIALEQKINIDEYEIDLSQISEGVVGFKPKEEKPEKPPEKKKE